tara:strand:- start:161 stop:769 length:609 start_codon:yes stop_codon:yes gene_type:complete
MFDKNNKYIGDKDMVLDRIEELQHDWIHEGIANVQEQFGLTSGDCSNAVDMKFRHAFSELAKATLSQLIENEIISEVRLSDGINVDLINARGLKVYKIGDWQVFHPKLQSEMLKKGSRSRYLDEIKKDLATHGIELLHASESPYDNPGFYQLIFCCQWDEEEGRIKAYEQTYTISRFLDHFGYDEGISHYRWSLEDSKYIEV